MVQGMNKQLQGQYKNQQFMPWAVRFFLSLPYLGNILFIIFLFIVFVVDQSAYQTLSSRKAEIEREMKDVQENIMKLREKENTIRTEHGEIKRRHVNYISFFSLQGN